MRILGGPAVGEWTLNQAGNTFFQFTPTSHELPSSAKKRMSSVHSSIWRSRLKITSKAWHPCNRGLIFAHHSSLPKMLSGANAFEISDIQDDETEASLVR